MFSKQVRENLSLRLIQKTDAEQLFMLINKNRDYLREWLGWVDDTQTLKDIDFFIKSSLQRYTEKNGLLCTIVLDNNIIGVIDFNFIDQINHQTGIGYWLSEDMQGKGIITDSCKIFIDYAFDTLNLNRIQIPAAEGNFKSRAVAERLGMKFEGIIREREYLYGRYINHAMYSLLRREWGISNK
ncbi:MAG: GNAT family protein [Cyanobacteria bacterium P01_A01_bin.45]